MGDTDAVQEAIQRAKQLAAKLTQSAPPRRSALPSDHSGPVKVTLAYEKPANNNNNRQHDSSSHHRSSTSRDRESGTRSNRESSRDYRDNRDANDYHGRDQVRERNPSHSNSHPQSHEQRYDSPLLPNPQVSDDQIEMIIPHTVIGLVIGKGGENIKRIQNETCATVRVDPNPVDEKGNKMCTITGTKKAVEEAHNQITHIIENSASNKRPRLQTDCGSDSFRMIIPASRTGAIIGKGGETIKSIKQQSGCDIELDKSAKECGPDESVFIIRGTQDKILKARSLIEARLAQRRDGAPRDSRQPKGVATGANAAPVASAVTIDAAGQQNQSAAWAAYYAQYSALLNQAGAQPGFANPGAVPQLDQHQPQQPQPQLPQQPHQPQQHQHQPQQPQQQPQPAADGQKQDYSDQWIEYYLAIGRPDYAERIVQMKRQQVPRSNE